MSEIKARYVGPSQTGVDLRVELGDGDWRHIHVAHGGELPTEIDGVNVPAAYRDALLEQSSNWTQVRRATGDEVKAKTTAPAAKDGDK